MATLLTEGFEGGTSGTTITAANSGFSNGQIGTPTFDSSVSVDGTRSANFNPSGALEYLSHQFTAGSVFSIRFYANFNALPAAATYICVLLSGTTTTQAQIGLNANGTVRIRNATTLTATTTAALTPGTWYRFEWIVNGPAGTQSLRIFLGSGATAISGADISGAYTTGNTFDRCLFGVPVLGTLTWNADAVLATDTAAFLGPLAGATSNLLVDSGVQLQVAGARIGFGQGAFGAGGFGGSGDLALSEPQLNLLVDSGVQLQVAVGLAGVGDLSLTVPGGGVQDAADVLHAKPIVEVGFTTDPTIGGGVYGHWGDPQRGIWDESLWAPDDLWSDLTPYLQTFTFSRGATRVEGPVLRYEAGTATIVFYDPDGRFNPLNLSSPYVSAGRTQVRPMLAVRIRVSYGGAGSSDAYDQIRLFADSWQISYPSPSHSIVVLTATDGQKVLSRHSRVAGPTVGAGELPGARVHRILDSVGWPATDRVIDAGETPLAGTTLEGDAWTELLLVQDTEIGEVYLDAAGKVVFKGRRAILEETLSTVSQGVFGSDRAGGELPFVSLTPQYDDSTIRNVIRIGRVDGIAQEARDQASVEEFLESTHERSDLLMQTDAEALDYARYLLGASKDPELLFTELGVDPRAQPLDLFPQVLVRDFGDRITVRSRPPGITTAVATTGVGLNNTGPEKGAIPGTYGVDYRYDGQATLNYLAGLGCTFVRVMVRWERIQPTLGGPLDATELGRLSDYITRVATAGMHATLVVREGARYNGIALGDVGGPTQAQFVDLWSRLAATFANNPTVRALDNNEPHDLPDSFEYTNVATFDISQESWTSETGSGVTTARSTTTVHDGSGSLSCQKTVLGGVFGSLRVTDNVTSTHNESGGGFEYACWVFCPVGETGWFAQIDITDSAGANIAGTPVSLTPNAWTYVLNSFTTAQVAAMQRKIVQIHNAAPTAGSKTFFVDSIVHAIRFTGRQRWQAADQAAYDAVVAAGFIGSTRAWTAAGYAWSAATGYAVTNGNPWITPSRSLPVRYGAHVYYDNDHSGTYAATFATENSNAVAQGYASVTARALDWVTDFLDWLSAHGVAGFLGETGWPDTSSGAWNPVGAAVLAAAYPAVSVGIWAVGEIEGTGYPLTPWEASGGVGTTVNTPNVQATVVGPLLGGEAVTVGQGLVERDVYVRGIAAEYGGTNRWQWRWSLQPANTFDYGVWDQGLFDVALWAY